MPKRPPRMRARAVSSGRVSVVGTKGWKLGRVMVPMQCLRCCFVVESRLVGSLTAAGNNLSADFVGRTSLDAESPGYLAWALSGLISGFGSVIGPDVCNIVLTKGERYGYFSF